MRKLTKTILSLALCLSLMLGSSVSSMAASGTISYSSFKITYKTSATNVKISVTGFTGSNYIYGVEGNAYEVNSAGTKCRTKELAGYRGIGSTSSLVASVKADSGYNFKKSSTFNNAQLRRGRRIDLKDLVTLFNFKFTI